MAIGKHELDKEVFARSQIPVPSPVGLTARLSLRRSPRRKPSPQPLALGFPIAITTEPFLIQPSKSLSAVHQRQRLAPKPPSMGR